MIELSICIPSYNRFHVLKRNILSILTKTKSMDFEVVIIDNQSPKDVIQTLDITDKRLRIIKRNVPVSGTENVNQCVLYARGKYALLCLDKDYIDGGYLDDFISCLKNHNDIKGGICPVFSKKNGHLLQKFTNRVIEKKTDLLIHFGYTKKHPSGNFYLTECVKRAYQYSLSEEEKKNTYGADYLLAECAVCGPMLLYDKPMVFQESDSESIAIKSYSLSAQKNNLYFEPNVISKQLLQDFSHLKKLPCRRIEYYKTIWHLYRIALNAVTVDYKQVMQNASLCAHYRVPTKNVSKKEMRYWIRYLNNTFLSYRGLDIGIKYFLFIAINSGFWIEKGKYII